MVRRAYQNLPTYGYHVLQRFTTETPGSFPFSSVRIDRKQHVPESSNHSLYLIQVFSFSCPEGHKLLDCSVGLSPFSPKHNERCERQYRHEPPPAFALLRQGSQSFKSRHSLSYSNHFQDHGIYTYTCTYKKGYAKTYTNTCSYTFPYLYIYKYLCIKKHIVTDTTFEIELCGH